MFPHLLISPLNQPLWALFFGHPVADLMITEDDIVVIPWWIMLLFYCYWGSEAALWVHLDDKMGLWPPLQRLQLHGSSSVSSFPPLAPAVITVPAGSGSDDQYHSSDGGQGWVWYGFNSESLLLYHDISTGVVSINSSTFWFQSDFHQLFCHLAAWECKSSW